MAESTKAPNRYNRKNPRNDLTARYVRSILTYNAHNGILRWRRRNDVPQKWNARYAGTIAGTVRGDGYRLVVINGRIYLASRIIWLIKTGKWPMHDVDHKNVNPSDDRWKNLRQATPPQNGHNHRKRTNNRSGFKGVYWSERFCKWIARIRVHPKRINLGGFDNAKDAADAYCEAAKKYHKQFARFA